MKIFVFGSSITSCYWNGAATYYRGIYKNLHALGHHIIFAEPDVYNRQQHRDLRRIDYADVRVYKPGVQTLLMLAEAATADVVIKHSGVGAEDEMLEAAVLKLKRERTRVVFWDVDAPATLARMDENPRDPFRALVPHYDFVLTYGGGPAVVKRYREFGAQQCFPVYNALDPATHYPIAADPSLACDLAFVGNRLPDREERVEEFFLRAAQMAPHLRFILGGEGWEGKRMPANVRWIGHVGTADHNRVNCAARIVLNINRKSMAEVGFSPPTRVFEAAGAASCVMTDAWSGIEEFFEPGKEILLAGCAEEVVAHLCATSSARAREIGHAMHARALYDHVYSQRAALVDEILRAKSKPHKAAA